MWLVLGEMWVEVGEGGWDLYDVDEDDARLDDETVGEYFVLVVLCVDWIDYLLLRKNEWVMYEIVDGMWMLMCVNLWFFYLFYLFETRRVFDCSRVVVRVIVRVINK